MVEAQLFAAAWQDYCRLGMAIGGKLFVDRFSVGWPMGNRLGTAAASPAGVKMAEVCLKSLQTILVDHDLRKLLAQQAPGCFFSSA